jgi:hypothetical protein
MTQRRRPAWFADDPELDPVGQASDDNIPLIDLASRRRPRVPMPSECRAPPGDDRGQRMDRGTAD